eukprot:TRINITY_DN10032_c0_g3_i1.p1 TRINITY_DN10032_c0_g3~~TRINITY_DN10032_c0_g3_i1.p1  ORF type:complete len:309 (-),score=71.04 TRINITY_DN10032_c0_g3_i1:695-1621(-)
MWKGVFLVVLYCLAVIAKDKPLGDFTVLNISGKNDKPARIKTPSGTVEFEASVIDIYEIDGPKLTLSENGEITNTIFAQTEGDWTKTEEAFTPADADTSWIERNKNKLKDITKIRMSRDVTNSNDPTFFILSAAAFQPGEGQDVTLDIKVGNAEGENSFDLTLKKNQVKWDFEAEWPELTSSTRGDLLVFKVLVEWETDITSGVGDVVSGDTDVSVEEIEVDGAKGVQVIIGSSEFILLFPGVAFSVDVDGNAIEKADFEVVEGKTDESLDGSKILFVAVSRFSRVTIDPVAEYNSGSAMSSWLSFLF